MPRSPFDKAYYDRFYRNPKTRVATPADYARIGRFVCSYLKHLQLPVRTIVDLGCGLGGWQPVIQRHFRKATYQGVEISRYLCRELGWQHGSVADWRGPEPFDLVICHGVLQYLPAGDADRAIRNLARNCGGALFLEALTAEDWKANCDRDRTDGSVHLRPAAWYRQRLRRHFIACGGGVFVRPDAAVVMYELEKAET